MKEQKTLNDLISYYQEELKYTNKSINDTEIENACERERESNYKLFLSQLKQLKEDINNLDYEKYGIFSGIDTEAYSVVKKIVGEE